MRSKGESRTAADELVVYRRGRRIDPPLRMSNSPIEARPEAPSVRALTLYKHGLASVEREGAAGARFTMRFPRAQMSDVLKTLEVFVTEGEGMILSVRFDAPIDARQELEARGFGMRAGFAIEDMLNALRGREVEVEVLSEFEEDGESKTLRQKLRGTIVGLEGAMTKNRHSRLALLTETQALAVLKLDEVVRVTPTEAETLSDLSWLRERLRVVRSSEEKELEVRLEGGIERVGVRYAVPAPVWRTVYRIGMAEEDAELRLWAIVHNPLDEDLKGVTLTVTTGQPVSFDIDLYNPRRVRRAAVEESFDAVGPVAMSAPLMEESFGEMLGGGAPPPPARAAAAPMGKRKRSAPMRQDTAARVEQAKTDASGEHFQLEFPRPVDIARGGSALVPLAVAKVPSRRFCVYNASRGAHPDRVLELENASEFVLEEGPVSLADETGYAGEAMFPFTPKGAKARLVYARERGLRCRMETESVRKMVSLRFDKKRAFEGYDNITTRTLVVESELDEKTEVLFEVPRDPGASVVPELGLPAAEEDGGVWRVKVEAGRGKTEATFVVTRPERYSIEAAEFGGRITVWTEKGLLDPKVQELLATIAKLRNEGETYREQAKAFEAGIQKIRDDEKSLREQLAVLRADGMEGQRREEIVQKLRALEERIGTTQATAEDLHRAAAARFAEADQSLEQLAQA